MRFLKFIIRDYKSLSGTLEIDVSKRSLLPIIGINESGKTSILWAIFAFDHLNDKLNNGRHLTNILNLYKTSNRGEPAIIAEINADRQEMKEILDEAIADFKAESNKLALQDSRASTALLAECIILKRYSRIKQWDNSFSIRRNLVSREYSFVNLEQWDNPGLNNKLIKYILRKTPYILYFDDFRDIVQEEMEIISENGPKGWLAILEQLFVKTDSQYSVFKLEEMEELTRKSVLADVQKTLNNALAKEWEKFTLEEGSRLDVDLQFVLKDKRAFLKLLIRESVGGNERYFGIQDRSKGFYWFFNFVMKLEFNPKVRHSEDKDTIYLLDEPGSYLHSSAQAKLCEKLAYLSKNNVVIFCTHSHYLLDPDKIPLNNIRIAHKKRDSSITLDSLSEFKEEKIERRSALQPIMDALQIKPFLADLDYQNFCIVEGIYDYYVFEMFKPIGLAIKFLPSNSAESIPYYISISLAWRLNYVAMWDNDTEGKRAKEKAAKIFGEMESIRLLTLPSENAKRKKFILQNLIDGSDLRMIKSKLNLASNTSFEKTVLMLYFSENRQNIIQNISQTSKNAINYVYQKISGCLNIGGQVAGDR